ncbi:MAG: DUF1801 domain-containing protein [Kofleriaceae bacterium]|nr:DUF1801 domain-containing protein [Kofleriaceae bacterium]
MPFETVDDYLASLPQPARRIMNRVRTVIGKSIPACEESIAYHLLAYKLNGKAVLFLAAWKKHFSIYPAYPSILETFAKELAPYEVEKGTIRFGYDGRLPVHLIGRIAQLRLAEERTKQSRASRKAAKAPTAKPRKPARRKITR